MNEINFINNCFKDLRKLLNTEHYFRRHKFVDQ